MRRILILSILTFILSAQYSQALIPETMSYQGLLTNATGTPVPDGGSYSLTFRLYATEIGGAAIWTETHTSVTVVKGIFNVILGGATPPTPLTLPFDQQYWLSIQVGAGPELAPRVKLTSSAYSLNSRSVTDGAVTNSKISDNAVTVDKIQPDVVSSMDGVTNDGGNIDLEPGSNITIVPNDGANTITIAVSEVWRLNGNAGTTPGTNFLGTTDNKAVEFRADGARILRLEPNATSPNLLGGFSGNSISSGVYGATISGGGNSGNENRVFDNYGTIGGGLYNQAGDDAGTTDDASGANVSGGGWNTASGEFATVGGGENNAASKNYATIGGGHQSTASGEFATVSGGKSNIASGSSSIISGGESNKAVGLGTAVGGGLVNTASGDTATVAGGSNNIASSGSATVGGGSGNKAISGSATVSGGHENEASGDKATVSGGYSNEASGGHTTVSGGYENEASGYRATVSGGYSNQANGDYDTLGGGSENTVSGGYATLSGGQSNTASGSHATVGGGYNNHANGIYSTVPGGAGNNAVANHSLAAGTNAKAYHVGALVLSDSLSGNFASLVNNEMAVRCTGGARFVTQYSGGAPTKWAYLNPSTAQWEVKTSSNVNLKSSFAPVDGVEILNRLASMPVQTWNYKGEDESIRHIGPTAQNFYATFGMGKDDGSIGALDAEGVALAAIQGLYEIVKEKDAENAALRQQVSGLEVRLAALEVIVKAQGQ